MKLLEVEKNIFDDLIHHPHELWEWYSFFRYNYPDLSNIEVVSQGNDLLLTWIKRGWLYISVSREEGSPLELDDIEATIAELGLEVTNPIKVHVSLFITDYALQDVNWHSISPDGVLYTNPKDPKQNLRTNSGFIAAFDPLKRGPYVKISQNNTISYAPMAGNPTLDPTKEMKKTKLNEN